MSKSTKKSETKAAKAAKAPKSAKAPKPETATPDPKPQAKPTRAAKPDKPKRVSALDAAATVLQKAGKPLRSQEMIAAMTEQGLWSSPAGKTPHATLYAAILREINDKGAEARFKKVDRGQFEFNG